MSFKLKTTIATFIITTGFMAGLYYGLPMLNAQIKFNMLLVFIAAGLVLSVILSGITYAFTKRIPGKPVKAKEKEVKTAAPPPAEKALFDKKVVQVLSIFQKKGRLIDFLQEDISSYEDSRIGAAVRNIHKGCREALLEHMNIEPVMKEPEGSDMTVEEGFDPSAIRVTGNVAGSPPFKGVLRHSGWRVSETVIPPLPKNQDLSVIEPAEVEII